MPISEKTYNKRKQNIIAAATTLFLGSDYNSVSMDHIAEQAKISKPSLYNYFKSKIDLYYVCTVSNYNQRWFHTRPDNYDSKTGYQLVEEYGYNLINYGYKYPKSLLFSANVNQLSFETIVFHQEVSRNVVDEYEHLYFDVKEAFSNLFETGLADGSIKEIEGLVKSSTAMYFLYSLRGYIVERIATISAMKQEEKNYAAEHFNVDKLLELSREEIEFHLKNLLSLIKNN